MMFPPPCFTVGMVFFGCNSAFFLLQTRQVEFLPKSSILVSSDHMTFSQSSSGSSKCSLANFRRAWTCTGLSRGTRLALQDLSPWRRSVLLMVAFVTLVPALCRSFTRSPRVVLGFLLTVLVIILTPRGETQGQNLTVLLGAHDISENQKSNRAEVKFYHIHPGFDVDTLENDIMLLQLKTAVKKTKEVQWIPLPKKDKDVKPKTVCSVAGWGANKTNGNVSPRLLEVDVIVTDRKMCRTKWGKKPITPRMMCAGGSDDYRGFCQGDSGGPLVCKGTAEGIVSFNEYRNCNEPTKPNVYTQISKYLSWVKCIISSVK
ncbi:granzyme B(G,H)-like [Conger conger]|uniref:granzyme B(G,H)-like n=1 Tax=Conger conger TaxID=82655 RepID=UPI002A5A1526|nr:granzyme B(G,H)-like [Conger conger]